VLDVPDEIKSKIADTFKLDEKAAGRPNILQLLLKRGADPYKYIVEIVYRRVLNGESFDDLAEYTAKKYKLEVTKATIFNLFTQLEKSGLLAPLQEVATTKVKRKVRVWYIDADGNFRSDIDYIQSFIERKKNVLKPNVLRDHLKNLEEVINFTGKAPHEWNEEDITSFLNAKYEHYKKTVEERVNEIKEVKNGYTHYYEYLSDAEKDARARENTRRYLTTIRVFLKWIGRGDLAEKFGHTEWKRRIALTEFLTIDEFKKLMASEELDDVEKFILKLHLTIGCREGWSASMRSGLAGLQWSKIDWENATIDVFESKTKGGVWWRGIYLNIFFPNFIEELRYWYEHRVNDSDYILDSLGFTRQRHERLMRKVSKILGRYIRPHFLRHTHAVWLIHADVPLELVAGKPSQAPLGAGWEDLNTLIAHYGAFTKEKIARAINQVRAAVKL